MSIEIILADENRAMRRSLRDLIEKDPGLSVAAEAADGKTAVNLVRELSPQLVIIDADLLGSRGIDLIRQMLSAAPDLKVIALSILSDRRLALNILKAGASAYLLKDCLFDELSPAIQMVLAHKVYLSQGLSDIVLNDYVGILRESEAQFRTVFEHAPFGIVLLDQDGRFLETNAAFQDMLGYSHDDLHYRSFFNFAHPGDAAYCRKLFEELILGQRGRFELDEKFLRQDGRQVWGRLTVTPMPAGEDRPKLALAITADISDRKETEEEIKTYQKQLRAMASELSLIEERERRTLATDLHDHVGQILALAQIKLGELRQSAAALAAPLDEIRQLLEQTIKATRLLTFELSPPVLYDLGFEAAVEWFGENLEEQYNLQVSVQKEAPLLPLGQVSQVLLFKIVRELMINAAKHAEASHLKVDIRREDDRLRVEVADDGVGFNPQQVEGSANKSRSFGLFSVRERLQRIRGRLEVESAPGQGTRISILAPLGSELQE
jgi:PAS domain S-box-containing protein